MALLLIVMLSVGFFAGLKITKDAMANTCEDYLTEQNFYDFRLLSTLGFTEENVSEYKELSYVESCEGTYTLDALMWHNGGVKAMKLLALPDEINRPRLTAGRLPAKDNECVADALCFDESDIGSVIRVSELNEASVTDALTETEYTIVGIVNSPIYLNTDRGTTTIGNGALETYIYVPKNSFSGDIYTEINITLNEKATAYSKAYDEIIEKHKQSLTDALDEQAENRYQAIIDKLGIPAEMAEQFGLPSPETYLLTRDENTGYVSFESDTSIISGISNIFPLFFIMIAMLVCITTMTRMVDEERTQIGTLKAMGYTGRAITAKYLLYAGLATVIGWVVGFFLGTWGLPKVFWFAYNAIYDFAPIKYLFSPMLAVLTLAVSLVGILGSTWLSCRRELSSAPATLIRPRAGKAGKRILLERISPIWKRLPFLRKITLRNMFRYKQRLVMMLVGIGCCAGLVLTAFGVRDSMVDTAGTHFENVQTYQMQATFEAEDEVALSDKLKSTDGIDGYLPCAQLRVDGIADSQMSGITLMSFAKNTDVSDYWTFKNEDTTYTLPDKDKVLICQKVAEKLSLAVGDTVTFRDSDMNAVTLTVDGIFDSFVNNFVVISEESYAEGFAEYKPNTMLIKADDEMATTLLEMDEVGGVALLSDNREAVDSALSCLNYIIWLIVAFSGALAFVVIFNLTNINLAERSREIATVEVLGFYPKETRQYVLWENLALSMIAIAIGMPLGTLFHRVVMSMIKIDMLNFDIHITAGSYVLAIICTVIFVLIVNLFMRRSINKIHMAESLKAVE